MGFWQWMSGRRQDTVSEVAGRVVALVTETARPLVERRIARMGTNEARGYVRARAGHLLAEAIAMVTAHDRPSRRLSTEVVLAASLEQLLHVLQRHPAHITIRRAA